VKSGAKEVGTATFSEEQCNINAKGKTCCAVELPTASDTRENRRFFLRVTFCEHGQTAAGAFLNRLSRRVGQVTLRLKVVEEVLLGDSPKPPKRKRFPIVDRATTFIRQ